MTDWFKALSDPHHPTEWYLMAISLLLVGMWEVFLPKRTIQGVLSSRLGSHGVLYLLGVGLSFLVLPLSGLAFAVAVEKTSWGIALSGAVPWWIRFLAGVLALDLARYAAHYAFHAVGALWRIHAVHHSDIEFDMSTGVRHHPLEVPMIAAVEFAAIALFAVPPQAVFFLSCIGVVHAFFSHANASLPPRLEQWLRLVIITPEFHEIHHSADMREERANLGNIFPWWDRLFRTSIEPSAQSAKLRFGLDETQRTRELNVLRLLKEPFVRSESSPVAREAAVTIGE